MGNRLEGKVAIVTGGGRGIGRGEALALAAEGAKVIVNDFGGSAAGTGGEQGPADEVVAEIKKMGSDGAANYDNVADFAAGDRMVQQALDTFGRLDIVVNNAGILRDKMVFNMSEDEWDIVVGVHLKGHFNLSKHAAVVFRQQRGGVFVNTSSESGLGNRGQANYAAAKEGIIGLTRTLARDLGGYGVRANAIRPRAGDAPRDQRRDEGRGIARRRRRHGHGGPRGLREGEPGRGRGADGRLALHRRRGERQRPRLPRQRLDNRRLQPPGGRREDRQPGRPHVDARRARQADAGAGDVGAAEHVAEEGREAGDGVNAGSQVEDPRKLRRRESMPEAAR